MKEELIKLIDDNDVISFDIFDTLLLRNIYKPTDIFRILGKIASEKYGIEDFYNIRVTSEAESRTEENNRECHYDDIYKIIEQKIKNKKIAKSLKDEELKLEEKFLVVNPFMKEIYDYCLKKKKNILIISDMYLDENFIIKNLNRNGYSNYKFYLSNKYQKTKGDSSLFEVVYSENNFDKNKWLHIGDNYTSDYTSPIKFGINAYQYEGVYTHTKIKEYSIFEAILLGIQNNYLYNGLENDYWSEFGVKYVSLIYFGFTKWLYDLTKNLDNLFFIARDGYIIKKIYDIFNKDKKVAINYLYCSRKSFVIPSLYKTKVDVLVNNLSLISNTNLSISLKDYLTKCQIDTNNIDKDIITAFGFNSLEEIITEDNSYNAKKILLKFEDEIRNNLEEKYKICKEYLEQEGTNKFEKINVMDIGWAGSIQKSIKRLLNKEVEGYYFGTIDEKQKDNYSTMYGYYFDLNYEEQNKNEVIDNVMMYELIFSAPHGTTIGYEKKKNKIVPILDDNVEYNKIIKSFQDSAIEIIKKYIEYIEYYDYLTKDFCLFPYKQFIKNKEYEDVKMFSTISNDLVLGSDKKFNYVNTISEDDINDTKKFIEISNKSLWNNTFVIEDDDSKEKYQLYKNKLFTDIHNLNPFKYVKIYLDYGNGFNEKDTIFLPFERKIQEYRFKLKLTSFEQKIINIRIDPIENRKLLMKNLIICSDKGDVNVEIPNKNYLYGKIRNGIFVGTKDPKIIVKNVEDCKFIKFYCHFELY